MNVPSSMFSEYCKKLLTRTWNKKNKIQNKTKTKHQYGPSIDAKSHLVLKILTIKVVNSPLPVKRQ